MPESNFDLNASLRGQGVVHAKVSSVADGADSSKVLPSDWNAGHVFVGSHVIVRQYATSGSPHTWTKPTSARFVGVRRRVQGSGGAGGGAASTGANQSSEGAGGGGGGYAEDWLDAANCPSTMTVTVGAGGTAGTAGNNAGNNGNSTTITGTGLTTLSGTGGAGGGGMAAVTAGISVGGEQGGASGPSGAVLIPGADGRNGRSYAANQPSSHADGGGSFLGSSQRVSGTGTGSAGLAGNNYGGGGAGGINFQNQGTARQGGVGGDGIAYIEEFYI
jgi:hypothetical protein